MRKKFASTIFLIVLIIGIIGSGLLFSQTTKTESWTEYCQKQKSPDLICTQILVEKGILDSSACLDITNSKSRDACFYYAARNKNDMMASGYLFAKQS